MQLQAICAIVKAQTHGYCLRCYQLEYAGQLCTTGSILSLVPRPYSWDPGWINIVINCNKIKVPKCSAIDT